MTQTPPRVAEPAAAPAPGARTGLGDLPVGGLALRAAVGAGLVALVLALPLLIQPVFLNVASRAAVFALLALSMNILIGYTGQVSLGHNAFLGIGAFTAGYVLTELGLPWIAGVGVAAATGALAALVLGGVALRVTGLYLALVTLAYGLFAEETLFNIRALTGGGAGMPAPRPAFAQGDLAYAYLCIGVVGLFLLLDRRLTATRAGRAIQSLRDDERVAASWAMPVTAYKLLAFVLAGVVAGVAGALFASIEEIVVAADFEILLALQILIIAVLGGIGSRAGVVQAAVLVTIMPTLLNRAAANWEVFPFTVVDGSATPVIVAVLTVLVLAFFPGGIAQLERPFWRWLSLDSLRRPQQGERVP